MSNKRKHFLLVEPVAKTPYPPLGLMKIGTMLRQRHPECVVHDVVGNSPPRRVRSPAGIYVTSLFTWDMDRVVKTVNWYADRYRRSTLHVGGIGATLLPDHLRSQTGIKSTVGLMADAEECAPDYSLLFGRKLNASLVFTSRGCPRHCGFCSVSLHEPTFYTKADWQKDINLDLPRIQVWDNNFLASPRWKEACDVLRSSGKRVDFNQGLDARLFKPSVAHALAALRLEAVRFAFDNVRYEKSVVRAVELAKKHLRCEVRVYVLYNYMDTPEDLFYRINLLNQLGALSFPMEYRQLTASRAKFPGRHWNKALLRGLKLSLMYYYRRGMITESRKSFRSIYGQTPKRFVEKLYEIYEYDKRRKPSKKKADSRKTG